MVYIYFYLSFLYPSLSLCFFLKSLQAWRPFLWFNNLTNFLMKNGKISLKAAPNKSKEVTKMVLTYQSSQLDNYGNGPALTRWTEFPLTEVVLDCITSIPPHSVRLRIVFYFFENDEATKCSLLTRTCCCFCLLYSDQFFLTFLFSFNCKQNYFQQFRVTLVTESGTASYEKGKCESLIFEECRH